jgi:hypothetical protein
MPPTGILFERFHKSSKAKSHPTPRTPTTSPFAYPAYPPFVTPPGPYFTPHPYSQYPMYPSQATPSTVPSSKGVMSSDGADEIVYPDIGEFLATMEAKNPKRKVVQFADTFDAEEFYSIEEISTFGAEDFIRLCGMKEGTAAFLVDAIKKEMKKAQKIACSHNL